MMLCFVTSYIWRRNEGLVGRAGLVNEWKGCSVFFASFFFSFSDLCFPNFTFFQRQNRFIVSKSKRYL